MPSFGFGRNKSGGPERGVEVKPLEFSDLTLKPEEETTMGGLIALHAGTIKPVGWIRDEELGDLFPERSQAERDVMTTHILDQIETARAAKKAAEAAPGLVSPVKVDK